MSESNLVVVRTFGNSPEANLALSALEAAGIDAMIRADNGGGMRSDIAWAGVGVQLIVREEDAEVARSILDVPARPILESA